MNESDEEFLIPRLIQRLNEIRKKNNSLLELRKSKIVKRELEIKKAQEKYANTSSFNSTTNNTSQRIKPFKPFFYQTSIEFQKSIFQNSSKSSLNNTKNKMSNSTRQTTAPTNRSKRKLVPISERRKVDLKMQFNKEVSKIKMFYKERIDKLKVKSNRTEPSQRQLEESVYKTPKNFMEKLNKIRQNKNKYDLKSYQDRLLKVSSKSFSTNSVIKLDRIFIKMRKDSKVKITNSKRFLRLVEKKEEVINKKMERSNKKANYLFEVFKLNNQSGIKKKELKSNFLNTFQFN